MWFQRSFLVPWQISSRAEFVEIIHPCKVFSESIFSQSKRLISPGVTLSPSTALLNAATYDSRSIRSLFFFNSLKIGNSPTCFRRMITVVQFSTWEIMAIGIKTNSGLQVQVNAELVTTAVARTYYSSSDDLQVVVLVEERVAVQVVMPHRYPTYGSRTCMPVSIMNGDHHITQNGFLRLSHQDGIE